jgi:hypothetical protein
MHDWQVELVGNGVVWIGDAFHRDDGMHSAGVLVFVEGELVGAFLNQHSSRSPMGMQEPPYDYHLSYAAMPAPLRGVLERQIVPIMTHPELSPYPMITAGLWTEGGRLQTAESWETVLDEGGDVFYPELLESEAAIGELTNARGLGPEQVAVLRSLSERRIRTPRAETIVMEPGEIELALTPLPDAESLLPDQGITRGVEAMRVLLAPLRIVVP